MERAKGGERGEGRGICICMFEARRGATMRHSCAAVSPPPAHALVDGWPVPTLAVPQTAIVKGDAKSFSIAAASILAKVTRDRILRRAADRWPAYAFADNKGYPSPAHRAALATHGATAYHRRSWSFNENLADLAGSDHAG